MLRANLIKRSLGKGGKKLKKKNHLTLGALQWDEGRWRGGVGPGREQDPARALPSIPARQSKAGSEATGACGAETPERR